MKYGKSINFFFLCTRVAVKYSVFNIQTVELQFFVYAFLTSAAYVRFNAFKYFENTFFGKETQSKYVVLRPKTMKI